MILVRFLIDLMAFNIPTERGITDNDILCSEKGLHSKIVKVVYSSSRVTITFLTCGFSFTVQHTNVSCVITTQNSPLHTASCRLKPSIDGVRVRCSTEPSTLRASIKWVHIFVSYLSQRNKVISHNFDNM